MKKRFVIMLFLGLSFVAVLFQSSGVRIKQQVLQWLPSSLYSQKPAPVYQNTSPNGTPQFSDNPKQGKEITVDTRNMNKMHLADDQAGDVQHRGMADPIEKMRVESLQITTQLRQAKEAKMQQAVGQ